MADNGGAGRPDPDNLGTDESVSRDETGVNSAEPGEDERIIFCIYCIVNNDGEYAA
jgi:hypothetical protein